MKKKFLRQGILVVLVILVFGEIILSVINFSELRSFGRQKEILDRQKVRDEELPMPPGNKNGREFENRLVIHPFFGYVYNRDLNGINNFGFKMNQSIDLSDGRYCFKDIDRKQSLVVGIFGGSFAEQTAGYGEYLTKKFASAGLPKKVIVLNFAIGGYAVPQSVFAFLYFRELFDVVIFVDGLNEIWNPSENNKAGYPPEFAKAHHFKYLLSRSETSPAFFEAMLNTMHLKKQLHAITLASLLPVVRQSLVVHEIWKAAKINIENRINYQSWKIIKENDSAPDFFNISDEKIIKFSAVKWFEYHKLVHEAAVSSGIYDIHILQPNPYVPGSKRLTEEEQRAMKNSYPIGGYVKQGYPILRKAVLTLQGQGVTALDLTDVFKNSEESLWVDSCHINEMGYKIILDQVYGLLQKILKDQNG